MGCTLVSNRVLQRSQSKSNTQECIPVGCLPSAAVAVLCVCGGGLPRGGGVFLGGRLPRHLPPVNRITDRCKNITFSQILLRKVKIIGLGIFIFTPITCKLLKNYFSAGTDYWKVCLCLCRTSISDCVCYDVV